MDVHQAINLRRSVRSYSSRPILPESLTRLQAALRSAPSACNLQPWHFIFVTEPELRQSVAIACMNQIWMATAPLTVVGCGLPKDAYKHMGGHHSSIDIDVAIALDHLTLAAVAEGLGTCWIGAFDEEQVKELLSIPVDTRVIALLPVGYPQAEHLNHPLENGQRKPSAELFSANRFGARP